MARILVVDDEKNICDLFKKALSKKGHEVDTVESGEEALKKIEVNDYDIAFMDIKMSGMDGVETFRHLRKIKPNVKVVIITGFSTLAKGLIDADVEKGICKILYKPININSLCAIVDEIITKKEKGKEAT